MKENIIFKPIKLPTLNELLNIADDIDFKFVYYKKIIINGSTHECFEYSNIYRINNNRLLYSEDTPFQLSNLPINVLMSKDFIGIEKV